MVDALARIESLDIDGVVLSWVNYPQELRQWNREVMPLLEQAGLRKPYIPDMKGAH